jgi:hypothetical protein
MRCLGALSACIIGPLMLTAGATAFLAALSRVALGAWDWTQNGRRVTREGEDTARLVAAASQPQQRSRARTGGAAKRAGTR